MTTPAAPSTPADLAHHVIGEFLGLAAHLPCLPGWTWSVSEYAEYHRACQDGTPTMHLEFKADDHVEFIYLIGRHDLDTRTPEVES